MKSNEPSLSFFLTLDVQGEQLQVDRPAGEHYCNFALMSATGEVRAYFSGYGAIVELVVSRRGSLPFLRIGCASIPLPANTAELKRLARFLGVPCPDVVEELIPDQVMPTEHS